MRTSFHHQPEAQHPKSPAIETPAGRLPHLSAESDQMAIQEDRCSLACSVGYAIGDAARMIKEDLLGTWKIVSFKAVAGDETSYPLGEHPSGYIGFSPAR